MGQKQSLFVDIFKRRSLGTPVSWLGGGPWSIAHAGETFASLMENGPRMAEVIIDTHAEIPTDIVFVGSGFNNFHVGALGGRMKFRKIGAPDLEEPLVKNRDDLEKLELRRLDEYSVAQAVRSATRIVQKAIGDRVLVGVTSWGPFTLAGQLYGVERLMHDIYKDKEAVKAVTEFATRVIIRFYEPFVADGLKVLSIADPTASGDLISRDQFREFALPFLQELGSWARDEGGELLLHICGDTSDRLDLIAEVGADCFSLDSKVGLSQARRELEGRIGLAGNVDPIRVLAQGTAQDVVKETQKCLIEMDGAEDFILMPGCDLSPATPAENIKALIDTARSWKR